MRYLFLMEKDISTTSSSRILFCFGTRPEAIKMAPLIKKCSELNITPIVCFTGQHKDMADSMLEFFNIKVDFRLETMSHGQSLARLSSQLIEKTSNVIEQCLPDYVIVQGDTASTFAGAMAALCNKIPIVHVEAGLRTDQLMSPFPEEANRRLTSHISQYHFAPTEVSAKNLKLENITKNVFVVGNTGIDALRVALEKIDVDQLKNRFPTLKNDKKTLLITTHRRENLNDLEPILKAVRSILETHPKVQAIFPVHKNPIIGEVAQRVFADTKNMTLVEPLEYPDFVGLMSQSHIILSDSGGIQEEAPYLGKPIVVLRDTTERPETIDAGAGVLAGKDPQAIIDITNALLSDESYYNQLAKARSPFGDGHASEKILRQLADHKPASSHLQELR